MKKKLQPKKRYCGNCQYHNSYDYPSRVFCFVKFQKRDNPILSVFDHCNTWELNPQECFCLEDASKKQEKKQ